MVDGQARRVRLRDHNLVKTGRLGGDYTRFWTAQAVSFLGNQVTVFALPLVAVLTLRASVTQMGVLLAVQQVPNAIVGPLAGPLVDHVSKRRLLIVLDLVLATLTSAVPILFLLGILRFVYLVLIAFGIGAAAAAFDVCYVAFIPDLVPAVKLLRANGGLEGAYSTAQVAGPGLGGILVSSLRAPLALLVDALSFLFSAAALAFVRSPGRPVPALEAEPPGRYLRSLRAGIRIVWSYRALRLLGLGSGMFNLFAGGAAAVSVLFVVRELGVPPAWFGMALAIGATGGVLGAAAAARIDRRAGTTATVALALGTCSTGELVIAVVPAGHRVLATILVAAGQFVAAAGVTVFLIAGLTIRQRIIPRDKLGSAYGSMRLLSRCVVPLGALLGGAAAPGVGLRAVIAIAGSGQLLTALVFAFCHKHLNIGEVRPTPD